MNGTLNGMRLRQITSRMITTSGRGTTLDSFRAAEMLTELEAVLRRGRAAPENVKVFA